MRSSFKIHTDYYAQLYRVQRRAIENRDRNVTLIRLEFQVFHLVAGDTLSPTGSLACRDLVICPAVQNDAGVRPFGEALQVEAFARLDEWEKAQGRWVKITFGAPEKPDFRNPFATIDYFGTRGLRVEKTAFSTRDNWVSPAVASRRLNLSESTVRRRAVKHAQEWGDNVVKFKIAGKRRDMIVNVALLDNLENG